MCLSVYIIHCSSNLRTHCNVGPNVTLQLLQFCRRGRLKTSVLLISAPKKLLGNQFPFEQLVDNRPVKYENTEGDVML